MPMNARRSSRLFSPRNPQVDGLVFILRLSEPGLVVLTSLLAYLLRHGTLLLPSGYAGVTLLAALVYLMMATLLGVYHQGQVRQLLGALPRLAGVLVGTFALVVAFLFLFKISTDFSRVWMTVWFGLLATGTVALRLWAHVLLRRRLKAGQWVRRIAVLGTDAKAMEVVRHLSLSSLPENAGKRVQDVRLYGLFSLDGETPQADLQRTPLYKGTLDDLMAAGLKNTFDDLIVTTDLDTQPEADKLLSRLHQLALNVHYCLPLPLFGRTPQEHPLYHLPLVLLYRRPLEGPSLWLKRVVDVCVSSAALLLLAPLMLVVAALIKLTSRGPVFFRQQRGGFNGEGFEMLKFRSMRPAAAKTTDASGKEKQASKDDPRITPVGRFIRKTSIDELPQLINVLKGDMSLVGPRPHVPSHNSYYGELIDRYASRHKMRPGLTGWAQLHGLRGETDTLEKMAKRVEYDIWYVENWSLALDLKIILLTPLVVLFQRGAY